MLKLFSGLDGLGDEVILSTPTAAAASFVTTMRPKLPSSIVFSAVTSITVSYDQADKLISKTNFPTSAPNSQYARYHYYLGRIKAVQLD
jgi:hypothetical protein